MKKHALRRFGALESRQARRLGDTATRSRILFFGYLSVGLFAAFIATELLLLGHVQLPAGQMPSIDLGLKLLLVASFLSFCLFAMELRIPHGREHVSERAAVLDRPEFEGAVEARIRSDAGGAVLLLSLSGVSEVSMATHLRRTLLKEIELRIVDGAPTDWVLARWPPGVFAVLLAPGPEEKAMHRAALLLEKCRETVTVGVRSLDPSLSMSLVLLQKGAFERSDQAIHAARLALRSAEATDRSNVVVYERSFDTSVPDREVLALKLPRAIYNEELEVFLHPLVALEENRVTGFEALARWQVDGRLIEAGEIVEVAEYAGTLIELDMCMLRNSVRLISDWNRRRKTSFGLSVNLSPFHFLATDGIAFIKDALEAHVFSPRLLTIELTQTDHLIRDGRLAPALAEIRDLGCRISIDDFGAGPSTIADLRKLPADEIKIDGSLLRDLEVSSDCRAIMQALLHLADRLGIETIIEGVERATQVDALIGLGYKSAQGFEFGPPRPASEWLADVTFARAGGLRPA